MVFEEKTLASEMIYRGRIINLRRDQVTVVHGTSYREIVEHNGGALIAALTDKEELIMVRQFRKPAERVMLEVPAGKRDGDETGREVAIRELKEETGYTARSVTYLTDFYTSPGFSTEVLSLYLAEGLVPGDTDFDENEALDILPVPLNELMDMVMRGEIHDGKTEIAILMTAEVLRRRKERGRE
ncbi:MAG: NUDIX hydrolase [Firmicutes bacterium]|nr:NUDIX hydrolase [Bacillota bacterium]MCR4710862.1 NUDIX hydrolase [Clostridia bacterium]